MIRLYSFADRCPTLDGPDPHTLARLEALNVEVIDRLNPFG